jgi:hypothetical protein
LADVVALAPPLRRLAAALACLLLVGCGPIANDVRPPPLDQSSGAMWLYAAYLLGRGEAAQARGYLDAIARTGLDGVSDPSLFYRDLAEACLFSGDSACAEQASGQARDYLGRRPTTAQFRDDDRRVFVQSLDALQAAATRDDGQLQQLTRSEQPTPSADAWFLLGWVEEQHGDLAAARSAYRAYLLRAPQWSFLRESIEMLKHAQSVAG